MDVIVPPTQRYGPDSQSQMITSNSIIAMGEHCLPFLLDKLGRHNSPLDVRLHKWLGKLHISGRLWRDPDLDRARAVTALGLLAHEHRLTGEARTQIEALVKSKNPDVAVSATYVWMHSWDGLGP